MGASPFGGPCRPRPSNVNNSRSKATPHGQASRPMALGWPTTGECASTAKSRAAVPTSWFRRWGRHPHHRTPPRPPLDGPAQVDRRWTGPAGGCGPRHLPGGAVRHTAGHGNAAAGPPGRRVIRHPCHSGQRGAHFAGLEDLFLPQSHRSPIRGRGRQLSDPVRRRTVRRLVARRAVVRVGGDAISELSQPCTRGTPRAGGRRLPGPGARNRSLESGRGLGAELPVGCGAGGRAIRSGPGMAGSPSGPGVILPRVSTLYRGRFESPAAAASWPLVLAMRSVICTSSDWNGPGDGATGRDGDHLLRQSGHDRRWCHDLRDSG